MCRVCEDLALSAFLIKCAMNKLWYAWEQIHVLGHLRDTGISRG